MKKTIVIALGVVATLFVPSCKKYDEGGRLGAADNKIVNSWKVEKSN